MTRYGIDAPTLLHVVSTGVAVHPDHRLVAPNGILPRALTLLLSAVRRGELTEREALALHTQMTELKIRLLGDRMSRRTAWNIAVEHGWDTLVEAEYLAVARLQADALVTIDDALIAKAPDVVPPAPLSALSS